MQTSRSIRQPGGKLVAIWLIEADLDLSRFRSNSFEVERPKGSGRRQAFPELDQIAYFGAEQACEQILRGQRPILREAIERVSSQPSRNWKATVQGVRTAAPAKAPVRRSSSARCASARG